MRQRRTPYLRQTVQRTFPPVNVDMDWSIVAIGPAFARMRITGPTNGFSLNGIPPLRRVSENELPTVCQIDALPPGTPYVELTFDYAPPVLDPTTFELEAGSLQARNALGGVLRPGTFEFESFAPPYPNIIASSATIVGVAVEVPIATPGLYINTLGGGTIQ